MIGGNISPPLPLLFHITTCQSLWTIHRFRLYHFESKKHFLTWEIKIVIKRMLFITVLMTYVSCYIFPNRVSVFFLIHIWFYLHTNLIKLSNVVAVTAKHKKGGKVGSQVPSMSDEELNVKRSDFPSDFLFGAGTAAAQVQIENDLYSWTYIFLYVFMIVCVYYVMGADRRITQRRRERTKYLGQVCWKVSRLAQPQFSLTYAFSN